MASSIQGTGAQNLSSAMRHGCSVVSGMALAPKRASRSRASRLVRPPAFMDGVGGVGSCATESPMRQRTRSSEATPASEITQLVTHVPGGDAIRANPPLFPHLASDRHGQHFKLPTPNPPFRSPPIAVERIDYGKGQRGAAELSTDLRYRFGFDALGTRAHGARWHGSDI